MRYVLQVTILWVLMTPQGAAGQQNPVLRGLVASAEAGLPLGLSIVMLSPGAGRQFTDAQGAFQFSNLPAGTYLLTVRQIGYVPLDTQIVIRGDSATTVRIALRRLAIELPPVTVSGHQCTRPGRPDSSDAALLAVFDQLQENSRRFALLADSYPFRYTLELSERTVSQGGDTGRATVRRLAFTSNDMGSYAVGGVVGPSYPPWEPGGLVIETGGPGYFANESFIGSHCFRLTGRDTIGGETFVRVDFEPGQRIWSADLSGAAFLDSLTYALRYMETSLTHPERTELDGVRTMIARTRFREIAPGVPLQDSMVVVTTQRFRKSVKLQTQRTIGVHFQRKRPVP